MSIKTSLSTEQKNELIATLKARFNKYKKRHANLDWSDVEKRLLDSDKLWSLSEMERTGGEPDVIGHDDQTGEYLFYDCVRESPKERRSFCYDQEALESRKKFKPADSTVNMAKNMGIELLTEEQYQYLQTLETVDTKTSSWLKTPSEIRKLGGAIFGDWRFGRVFIYHNGAESYYAARGFRGCLRI